MVNHMSVDPSHTIHTWNEAGNKVQRLIQAHLMNVKSSEDLQKQLDLLDDELDDLFYYYVWLMMQRGIQFSVEQMNRISPNFQFSVQWTPADVDLRNRLQTEIKGLYTDWRKDLAAAISESIGKSSEQIGAQVSQVLTTRQKENEPTPLYRGVLIARTEIMKAFNSAAEDRYQHAGFESVWVTAADEIVCPICGAKNGKVTKDIPPAHPDCRCVKVPKLKNVHNPFIPTL